MNTNYHLILAMPENFTHELHTELYHHLTGNYHLLRTHTHTHIYMPPAYVNNVNNKIFLEIIHKHHFPLITKTTCPTPHHIQQF